MMMILKKVAVILIVFIWARDSLAGCHRRSKRSSNEYILHRCTATAELIRKYRNGENVGSRKAEDGSTFRLQVQQRNSATNLTDASSSETPSSIFRRMTHMRKRDSGHARRISARLTDTPLRTLNINTSQGKPSVFKRKKPLPELAHGASNGRIYSPPRVVIIKPAN